MLVSVWLCCFVAVVRRFTAAAAGSTPSVHVHAADVGGGSEASSAAAGVLLCDAISGVIREVALG